MSRPPSSPADHSFRSFLGAAAALLMIVLVVAGLRSYGELSRQRSHEAMLLDKISATEERIAELESRIELLRTDPGTLERVAREDLGLVRAGDIVLKLPVAESVRPPEGGPNLDPVGSGGAVDTGPGSR